MKHRFFNLLAAVFAVSSLIALIAVIFLGEKTKHGSDIGLYFAHGNMTCDLVFAYGRAVLTWERSDRRGSWELTWSIRRCTPKAMEIYVTKSFARRAGFGMYALTVRDPSGARVLGNGQEIFVPTWLLPIGFASFPCYWMIGLFRRRRTRRGFDGLCILCGYDLRASKDRCPECGTTIAADQ